VQTRNPLTVAGVFKTNETITAASKPLWGHVGENINIMACPIREGGHNKQ